MDALIRVYVHCRRRLQETTLPRATTKMAPPIEVLDLGRPPSCDKCLIAFFLQIDESEVLEDTQEVWPVHEVGLIALVVLQIDEPEVLEDAQEVWPGTKAAARLARAAVNACHQMAGGCAISSTGGRRITSPVKGADLAAFLREHHSGLLACAGSKLFQFLRKPQESPFFVVATSGTVSGTVSVDLDALHAAARLSREDATSFLVLSPSTCATSQTLKVRFLP